MTFWTKLPPVLLLALILHTSVMPDFRVLGVAADVLLLLGVAAGIVAGPERGAVVGFVAGLAADLFVQTPFGLSALAYSLTGFAVGTLQGSILRAAWWIPVTTSAVACGLGVLLFALAGAVVGQTSLVNGRLATVVLVVALLDGVLSVLAVKVMRWTLAGPETRGMVV